MQAWSKKTECQNKHNWLKDSMNILFSKWKQILVDGALDIARSGLLVTAEITEWPAVENFSKI